MEYSKRVNRLGQVFNELTVIRESPKRNKHYMWLCLCSCGNTRIASGNALVRSIDKSCNSTSHRLYKLKNNGIAKPKSLKRRGMPEYTASACGSLAKQSLVWSANDRKPLLPAGRFISSNFNKTKNDILCTN